MSIRFDLIRKLHAFVMALPPDNFNLDHVMYDGAWKKEAGVECGTVACALGWAPAVPEIAAIGVRWARNQDGTLTGSVEFGEDWFWSDVAKSAFNLDYVDATYLFEAPCDPDTEVDQHKSLFDSRVRSFFLSHGEVL